MISQENVKREPKIVFFGKKSAKFSGPKNCHGHFGRKGGAEMCKKGVENGVFRHFDSRWVWPVLRCVQGTFSGFFEKSASAAGNFLPGKYDFLKVGEESRDLQKKAIFWGAGIPGIGRFRPKI